MKLVLRTDEEFNKLIKNIEENRNIFTPLILDNGFYTKGIALKAEQIEILATALKKNPKITYLSLAGHKINDDSAIVLASVHTLIGIDLRNNNITHIGATALAKSNLGSLILSSNDIFFSEENSIQFAEMIKSFANNKTLKYLDLENCGIPSLMLGELIGKNGCITYLALGGSNYPYSLTDDVLKFIGHNKVLKELYLYETIITNKGISYLEKNESINILSIKVSNITDKGIPILARHSSLKELSLEDGDLTYNCCLDLATSTLEELYLSVNKKMTLMSPEECQTIISTFHEMQKEAEKERKERVFEEELEIEEEISAINSKKSEQNNYPKSLTYEMEEIEEETQVATNRETTEDNYQATLSNSIIFDSNVQKVLGDNSMDISDSFC